MATREIDVLGAAMAETEKEIFGEAFGKEETVLDETGDRSIEQMGDGLEGQHEPDDEDDEVDETEGGEESGDDKGEEEVEEGDKAPKVKADEQTDKAADPEPKPDTQGRVPSSRLREANERARAAEAAAEGLKAWREEVEAKYRAERESFEARLREVNARSDGILAALQRQQPQDKPKPDIVPDIFEDPHGYREYQDRRVKEAVDRVDQQNKERYVELSMRSARRFYGETFDKAHQTLASLDPRDPANQTTVRRILNSPDPGEAVMQWHNDNELAREIGGKDLATYRKQVAEEAVQAALKDPEIRKRIFDEARAEASGSHDRPANTITRLPKSLNGAKGGNSNREPDPSLYDDSDSAVFDSAFPRSP